MGEAAGVRAIVVVAYLVTAVLVARASQTGAARERRFWLATAAILVLLGCAKQLRIEASLTNSLRNLAQSGGWYELHREVQTTFAALALLASAALALVLARWGPARLRCLGQSGGGYSWIAARLLDAAAGVYPRRGHVDDR